jgi:uncharacterized protein (TIGR03437 family)
VFQTHDFGATWEDISRNLPDIPVNAVLFDLLSPETLYAGTDIGVFLLTPLGSWTALQDGMPNAIVLGLSQNPITGSLVAATHGRGAFLLTISGPGANAPRMDSVVNGANFQPGSLAPGMLATLFGANLVASTVLVSAVAPLPVSLAGTTLLVNNVAAPLFQVSPGQLTLQVPYGVAGPTAELVLRTETGEAVMRLPLSNASPGIFGRGMGSVRHADGTLVTDFSPASPGLGTVEPPVESGVSAPTPAATTISQPTVRVAGVPAEVRFSGLTPGFVGVYQINFAVPSGVSGTAPVTIEMDGVASEPVLIAVRP